MDVIEAISTRRSIRKFTGEPISDSELDIILRAGFQSPSAHNRQPWEFIVIKDKSRFEALAKVHKYAQMTLQAGACIIVCGNTDIQELTGFLIEDCSASIQNILLASHGIGLGAVWVGLYPITEHTNNISNMFSLPGNIIPVGMVVIGRKGEEKDKADRFNVDKVHYETW
ncbi:MAG: nitroreductase family protein [Anaerolineaceae bacterium]|nr:MAG: nitroreductase family protein [Anaerolineaceae bacterium]